ncbi:MAG: thiamine phosphate synthase [Boseongicola sp.]|nr:thiamine phosphate synthase [Boseongicola sp.]
MAEPERPQIYLVSPPEIELSTFPDILAEVLDEYEIACLRLALASHDEDTLSRAGDTLREVAHARDVAIVIDTHVALAERLGLDGVHLNDGSRSVRAARKALGSDAIVGSYCAQSRHDGMTAAESGADYVAFGPIGETALGDGSHAELELFEWWSQMIEVPVVAEGALTPEAISRVAPFTDFFGIGEEIWRTDDPMFALSSLFSAMD